MLCGWLRVPFQGRNLRCGLVPGEVAFNPDVRIPDEKNRKEDGHFEEGKNSERSIHERPRKQEDDFNIKDQEHERDDIEADVETNPGITDRFFPAFVGRILSCVWAMRAKDPSGNESRCRKNHPNQKKNEGFTEFREHVLLF